MKATEPPVIVEESFECSSEVLWEALTNPDKMKEWYFDNIPDFRPEIGFETRFPVHVEDRTYTHIWNISEVIPEKKLVHSWRFEEHPGDAFVSFEIFSEANGSKLKLTNTVTEDFPDDIPEFRRESCEEGWKYFIKQRLKEYLET
ncbi:MAG: SRPBCC domain-containing protein [Flavobacteriaceae bacterium]|nr:SRPBCC domain-containing protein [Flavobacteriaceae bacterium]